LPAEIEGELLLELPGSRLESSKWRKPQSGEDPKEVRNNIHIGGEL